MGGGGGGGGVGGLFHRDQPLRCFPKIEFGGRTDLMVH